MTVSRSEMRIQSEAVSSARTHCVVGLATMARRTRLEWNGTEPPVEHPNAFALGSTLKML